MKILVADDHAIFRQGLRVVLNGFEPTMNLFEAGDFGEALKVAGDTADLALVLVDLRMPEMDGFDGLRALRRLLPSVPILVLSASEDPSDVFRALECGASGYLPKSSPEAAMLDAFRLVLVGGVYVPRELVGGGKSIARSVPTAEHSNILTPRQSAVLALIADGHSNKEIAHLIGTTEGTVKTHVTAIMRTLGVRNRVQLLLAAERHGIRSRPSA